MSAKEKETICCVITNEGLGTETSMGFLFQAETNGKDESHEFNFT